jgi:hypothetical protein
VQRGHSDTITCPLPGLPSGVARGWSPTRTRTPRTGR